MVKSEEILAIIPARGGSKGIRNKNLKLLAGKPLIQYTIDAVKGSKLITRTILSSDSLEIINYCKEEGIEAPFVRPKKLAQDDTSMLEVVIHTLSFLKEKENYIPDYIILLQPTSPLRTSKHIDEALLLLVNSDADSIVSVIEVPHNFNPYSVMKLDGNYIKPYLEYDERLNIRQMKPKFFARNGPAVLAFSYECVINKKSMYGDKILPYFMNREESIDIDSELDLLFAEFLIKSRYAK